MDPKRRSSLPGPNSQSGERPLDLSQEEGEQAQGESGDPPKRTLSGEQRRRAQASHSERAALRESATAPEPWPGDGLLSL